MENTGSARVRTGEPIAKDELTAAIAGRAFAYTDGSTQTFAADGTTVFVENGASSTGEWGVGDDGRFWSFWPPSYRAAYAVTWVADADGRPIGARFDGDEPGSGFEGRYV